MHASSPTDDLNFPTGHGLQLLLLSDGSYPGRHLHPPVGRVQFPSPLQSNRGEESTTTELATHCPSAGTIAVNSDPVGVSGKSPKLETTEGQTTE